MRGQAHTPSSLRAQQVCAECLGLLGAVDPARVSVELCAAPRLANSDADILVALISDHLVRLLRVASSRQHLDSATFAIQVGLPASDSLVPHTIKRGQSAACTG